MGCADSSSKGACPSEIGCLVLGSQAVSITIAGILTTPIYLAESMPKRFDGKSKPPPYEPPVYKGPEPSAQIENGKTCT